MRKSNGPSTEPCGTAQVSESELLFFYSYELLQITILLSTIQILITILHYMDDTVGSEKIMTTP